MPTREDYMNVALEAAQNAAQRGGLPYGAILVKAGEVVATAYNTAQQDKDMGGNADRSAIAHAEINLIRHQTQALKRSDPNALNGYTLYSTCEPCPMCAAACVWSGISTIVFGASIADLIGIGQPQIAIPCETIVNNSFHNIEVISGVLAKACLDLFRD
jgi:tRNA(adenine34) deaminase